MPNDFWGALLIKRCVGESESAGGEPSQQIGGLWLGDPAQPGSSRLGRRHRVGQRHELDGDQAAGAGEQPVDATPQHAAWAAVLLVVPRLVAAVAAHVQGRQASAVRAARHVAKMARIRASKAAASTADRLGQQRSLPACGTDRTVVQPSHHSDARFAAPSAVHPTSTAHFATWMASADAAVAAGLPTAVGAGDDRAAPAWLAETGAVG